MRVLRQQQAIVTFIIIVSELLVAEGCWLQKHENDGLKPSWYLGIILYDDFAILELM